MNNEVTDLQQIAQLIDDYIETYNNSYNLDKAADLISDELEERDVKVSFVTITRTYSLYVKHKGSITEDELFEAVSDNIDCGNVDVDDEDGEVTEAPDRDPDEAYDMTV